MSKCVTAYEHALFYHTGILSYTFFQYLSSPPVQGANTILTQFPLLHQCKELTPKTVGLRNQYFTWANHVQKEIKLTVPNRSNH